MDKNKEDLMKRTKRDLIQTIENQKSTLESRDKAVNDLKTTIESKDKTIENLKEETKKDSNNQIKSLRTIIEIKEKEIEKWKQAASGNDKNKIFKLELEVKAYKDALKERTKQLLKYRSQHGNVLKILSGTLGQALDVNEIMEKEVEDYGKES